MGIFDKKKEIQHSYMDWSKWRNTGIVAVDMCAAIIVQHRQRRIQVKCLWLVPDFFKMFKGYIEKQTGNEFEDEQQFFFDTVEINMGTRDQHNDIGMHKEVLIELWTDREGQNRQSDYERWLSGKGKIFAMAPQNIKAKGKLILT